MNRLLPLLLVAGLAGCSTTRHTTPEYRESARAALTDNGDAFAACGPLGPDEIIVLTTRMDGGTGVAVDIRVDEERTTAPPELAQCYVYAMIGVGLEAPDVRSGYATIVWRPG